MITNDILTQRIAALEVQVKAYAHSHLQILSGPAIRYELAQLSCGSDAPPCVDLLVFDWRKQNEWNSILGWDAANVPLSQAARVDYAGLDRRHARRVIDLRGQIGGDEIAIAVDAGDGRGLLRRLLRELIVMNAALTPIQRAKITQKTGGLIGGFCVAAVLVEGSHRPLADTKRALDMTGVLKSGRSTGIRATSGRSGTTICRMRASGTEGAL